MYSFGEKSENNLKGVHPKLIVVVRKALSYGVMDFSVGEGVRTLQRQHELLSTGATQTLNSKHLLQPDGFGHAVDLYPSPVNMAQVNRGYWPECIRFGLLAGLIMRAAQEEGVQLRWGMDWDKDGQTLDHSFFDAPHFELID